MNAKKQAGNIFAKFKDVLKNKIIDLIVVGIVGFIVIRLTVWAAIPSDIKDLKQDSSDNKELHKIFFKSIDTLQRAKVDKTDYREDLKELKESIKIMDERIFQIWSKTK